jgi:hypothetical protein
MLIDCTYSDCLIDGEDRWKSIDGEGCWMSIDGEDCRVIALMIVESLNVDQVFEEGDLLCQQH